MKIFKNFLIASILFLGLSDQAHSSSIKGKQFVLDTEKLCDPCFLNVTGSAKEPVGKIGTVVQKVNSFFNKPIVKASMSIIAFTCFVLLIADLAVSDAGRRMLIDNFKFNCRGSNFSTDEQFKKFCEPYMSNNPYKQ